ncbi:MAG: tetratricopeptide repeat protein, partial [Kofleriaceae bacterium]|nr:tetratricopeptide repeat protein [Kofleriaceae bacterium]
MTDLGSAAASAFDRYEQHLIAGGELLRQSRLDDAQKELLAALEFDADGQKALALLGLAYFRAGKFAEALPVYRRLVGLSALDASHQLNLGLVLLKLGDAGAAAAALERSRDIDPSQGRAVSYLGLAYARGGRFAEAYQAFLQAGQRDLAREIADNLTEQERLAIERAQERRSAAPAPVDAASASTRFVSTPPVEEPAAKPAAAPAVAPEAEAEAEAAPAAAEASPAAVEPDAAPARATTADDDAFDALERIDAPAPAESTSVDDGAVLEV